MSKIETLFRKYSTKFGQLPFIIIPVLCIPGYMYLVLGDFVVPLTVGILVCATIGVSYILGLLVKFLYYKPRPNPQAYKNRLQRIDASSFPSIHTSNSTILAFWGILSVIQVHNQTVFPYILICCWLLFFMIISLSRVVLKKHFPIDIIAGVIFGTICIAIVMMNSDIILGIMDSLVNGIMNRF